MFLIVQNMTTEAQFMAWGWRIPFLVSIVLVAVGLVIRLKVLESPAFKEVKESGTESEKPLVDVVKTHKRDVLTAMGMRIAENGTFYVLTVFVLAYGEDALKLVEEHDADRRDHRGRCSACSRSRSMAAVRPGRAAEAVPGGRGVLAAVRVPVLLAASTRRSRCSSGSRSCSASTSATT